MVHAANCSTDERHRHQEPSSGPPSSFAGVSVERMLEGYPLILCLSFQGFKRVSSPKKMQINRALSSRSTVQFPARARGEKSTQWDSDC